MEKNKLGEGESDTETNRCEGTLRRKVIPSQEFEREDWTRISMRKFCREGAAAGERQDGLKKTEENTEIGTKLLPKHVDEKPCRPAHH